MPFELCYVSVTFQTLINSTFLDSSNKDVLVIIDNILIYTKEIKEEHTNLVNIILNQYKKYSLAQESRK
jgi:F0F1-type ATP synthase beta subunit